MNGLIFMPFFRRDDMDIVYKASDPLDEFYRICDEQGEERRLEARRKLYEEKDFNCVYCLYHEKRSDVVFRLFLFFPLRFISEVVKIVVKPIWIL